MQQATARTLDSTPDDPPREAPKRSPWPWLGPTLVGAVLRIAITCVADDQFGDAPVRLEILDRFVAHPGLYWDFTHTFQYGPLPPHLAGLLALLGLPAHVAARTLVVLAGTISIALASRLAERFSGPRAALAAGLALALSPLHLQASTTFVSEPIYLAFALGAVAALLADRPLLTILCAFGASTTRYDTWLWLPFLALVWWWRHRKEGPRALVVPAFFFLGPASIALANAFDSGHPLHPLAFIAAEHVQLAARAEGEYGTLSWRISMLGYWPAALIGILTPGFAAALLPGLVRAAKRRSEALVPMAIGVVPPLLYTAKSVLFGSFWPMARFALGPASFLLAAMPPLRTRSLVASVVLALALDAGIVALADGMPGLGLAAAASSPISRLPADLKMGADALLAESGPVALDAVPSYDDLLITCASHRDRWNVEHPAPGVVPVVIVSLDGGAFDRVLRDSGQAFGAHYKRVRELGRVAVWRRVDR